MGLAGRYSDQRSLLKINGTSKYEIYQGVIAETQKNRENTFMFPPLRLDIFSTYQTSTFNRLN
jgi:hypothetical protein